MTNCTPLMSMLGSSGHRQNLRCLNIKFCLYIPYHITLSFETTFSFPFSFTLSFLLSIVYWKRMILAFKALDLRADP